MIFHELLNLVYELGEINRRAKRRRLTRTRYDIQSIDVLDVNYEDVLEYYRYKHNS